MSLIETMALEQGLLSFQLLQYHILMPSLLISKRASECDGCPSRLENIRAAKLSNHLAINRLSHLVVGYLATHHAINMSRTKPEPQATSTPSRNDSTCCESAWRYSSATMTTPVTKETSTVKPVIAREFPYLVSIQVTNYDRTSLHLCGGILISPYWVITAAHCLDSERTNELVVVAGETDLQRPTSKGKIVKVDEFFQHPNYTHYKKPYEHDVGLVHLAEEISENEVIQMASLPTEPFEKIGVRCQEAGWGPLEDNKPGSNVLKSSIVPVLPLSHCNSPYSATLGDGNICAGEEGTGACVGDNGGPLVCNSEVVAVMSWRAECAEPEKPAVYMDIAKYLPWIREITKIH